MLSVTCDDISGSHQTTVKFYPIPDAANRHIHSSSLFSRGNFFAFKASEINARIHLLAQQQVKMRTRNLRLFNSVNTATVGKG